MPLKKAVNREFQKKKLINQELGSLSENSGRVRLGSPCQRSLTEFCAVGNRQPEWQACLAVASPAPNRWRLNDIWVPTRCDTDHDYEWRYTIIISPYCSNWPQKCSWSLVLRWVRRRARCPPGRLVVSFLLEVPQRSRRGPSGVLCPRCTRSAMVISIKWERIQSER